MSDTAHRDSRLALIGESARGACPQCGQATLFEGVIRFAPRCRACGLDFSAYNVGDGPAAFLTLIIGGLVSALAIILQLAVQPPFWVHVLIWVPFASIAVIMALRASKAALLIVEHRNQGREGRLAEPPADDRP
ncbi:MAG: DUF983 domain-containing protein [Blastomonas sp.]